MPDTIQIQGLGGVFLYASDAAALAALASRAYVPAKAERVAVLVCGANPAPGPFD